MPTWGEASQIITAIAALAAVYMSWRNGQKIEVVRHATNSMKDELVAEVRTAAHAQGMTDQRAAENKPSALSQKV